MTHDGSETRVRRPGGRFFCRNATDAVRKHAGRHPWLVKMACCGLLLFGWTAVVPGSAYSFSEWYWIMEIGDRGDDVAELQSRLRFVGFYGGRIDGAFGSGTRKAVVGFQREFGLPADGRVGPQTKLKLANATKGWNSRHLAEYVSGGGSRSTSGPAPTPSSGRHSQSELKILARTVYGEARGEPYIGKVAVAAVVLNRIDNPAFPSTISGVVFQPRAFTAVDDGQIWLEPDSAAYNAARDAINGWDPSGGALYYFNPATATSQWIWSRPQIKRIGKHIFCM